MLRLVIGMQTDRGFTLIEILVVVLIVGITLGFALLAFGDFGGSRRITVGAERFANYMRLVQQQAILESSTLGIRLTHEGYQVFRFQMPSSWEVLSKKKIFHLQHFSSNTIISLEKKGKKSNPDIIINSSGDMTPFQLQFGDRQHTLATVTATHDGQVLFKLANAT